MNGGFVRGGEEVWLSVSIIRNYNSVFVNKKVVVFKCSSYICFSSDMIHNYVNKLKAPYQYMPTILPTITGKN